MSSLHQNFSRITGDEFFKPQGSRNLDAVFTPLLSRLNCKNIALIGGTNGKGETCLSLEWCLRKAHKSVATFTSPHTFCLTERFRLDGKNISRKKFEEILYKYESKYEGNYPLSYFELCFWIFLEFCISEEPDYIICEVGLGGRLDITNILTPSVSVITNISRDHTEVLGHTYREILREKLGICRKGVPLITSIRSCYLKKLIDIYNEEKKITVIYSKSSGDFSAQNKKLAESVYKQLTGVTLDELLIGKLGASSVDHRVKQKVIGESIVHCYGAHNLDGHRSLSLYLRDKLKFDVIILSFSKRSEQEIGNIIQCYLLANFFTGNIFINGITFFKSAPASTLVNVMKTISNNRVTLISNLSELTKVFNLKKNILWTGSYDAYELLND
jgi:dihydrofolate synthase/folylpolyglutamate synthase